MKNYICSSLTGALTGVFIFAFFCFFLVSDGATIYHKAPELNGTFVVFSFVMACFCGIAEALIFQEKN